MLADTNSVIPDLSNLKYIDPEEVLISPEYTFQDQAMVDEEGRQTFRTPHKAEKTLALAKALVSGRGLPLESSLIPNQKDFKGGYFVAMGNDEEWYVDWEPVCVEVNHPPRNIFGVARTAPEIYSAAASVSLVPYVKPASERSGMGHKHVGGTKLRDNPFQKFPNLLRNVEAYFHKHPALLWGFAEAFDIGEGSNIETFHTNGRQEKLVNAIGRYDNWYRGAGVEQRHFGLHHFLNFLDDEDRFDIFAHERHINLQHVKGLVGKDLPDPDWTGKLTIEFRGFRLGKTPVHEVSLLAMLLRIMDRQAEPGRLEPFQAIGRDEYQRFYTASKILADWEIVRKENGLNDPNLDAMIEETV